MKSASAKWARASGKLSCVAFAVMASSFAMADDSGWYAGANIGLSQATIDAERIRSELMPPPPASPLPRKVTFSADSLFDFDKSTVKPAGQQQLDKLASDVKGLDYDAIMVTVHTDRIAALTLKSRARVDL